MSQRIEIKVPDIGDFTDVPVIEVLVSAGDEVTAEQSLVTLESDKATMEVPSPAAGVIIEVKVALDDTVSQGDVVAVLESAEDGAAGGDDQAADEEESPASTGDDEAAGVDDDGSADGAGRTREEPSESTSKAGRREPPAGPGAGPRRSPPVPLEAALTDPGSVPYASPAIRAFARELGVDLRRVKGSGRKGRIVREDVSAFVKSVMEGAPTHTAPGLEVAPPPKVDFSKFGDTEMVELSRIKKIAGKNLHRNWVTIPHVTHHDAADITALESFRQEHKAQAKEQGFNLTPLVFLIQASVAALREFPNFNASLDPDGEHLVLKKYYNIGIAVDTPDGLVVPVIRDCERQGAMDLARELGEVSQRARDGKLKPADWQGAGFSISSLGGIGGLAFSPIINAPEVAILGVSRSKMEPTWDGESFQPRLMLPLSLSYDHRVIDGAQAARFTRFMATWLEDEGNFSLGE